MAQIVVENLIKKYNEQIAVDNISFRINKGEIVGFIGPNGAGKSTTMKIITSHMASTSGKVSILGKDIDKVSISIKKKIGYLPENNPLYSDMAIVDYLKFSAEIQGIKKSNIAERIKNMIHICGLNPEKHKKINELSKGYRQRVGLAQAIIHDPEILILDEPTTGLDPNQIIEIRNLIKALGKEKTIILSSHILSEVEAICNRIIIINRGRIVTDSSVNTLKRRTDQEALIVQIEASQDAEVEDEIRSLATVEQVHLSRGRPGFVVKSKPGYSSRRSLFDMCVARKWYLTEITGIETSLEEIFHDATH